MRTTKFENWQGVIEKYREFLPVSKNTPVVTLKEGNTPLIFAPRLSKEIGKQFEIYLKFEGLNPTGSFKDRGMTLAISKGLEESAKAVICASTGNTSASASAYAARAGLKCFVIIPEGGIALGKLAQAMVHGARVIGIRGNFDEALKIVRGVAKKYPITIVNSINPFRIEGQKTGAFEICEGLGGIAPDFHALPVGNAGNITAYWKGYKEYKEKGLIKNLPRMLGFQAEGAAPIVDGRVYPSPQTIATAIKIGNPASWEGALAARDESGGTIEKVSDEEILVGYRKLASMEGVFAEPASAASIAGVMKLARVGYFEKRATQKKKITIVCVLTGHGLKDPDRAIKVSKEPVVIPPHVDEALAEITRDI